MRNIAIVVAHPDDVAFCMGGTAWLLKDRYKLHVFCMTQGQRGLKDRSMDETAAIRKLEEQAACDLLGAELHWGGLIDGEVFAGRETCEWLAGELKALDPVAVFTMFPIDVADHATVYILATKAMHLAGIFHEVELYLMEAGAGGQTNQFDPDLYVDVTPVVEDKKRLMRCHICQIRDEAGVERWLTRERFRGRLARCEYAEGFKLYYPIVNQRWGRKPGYLLLDL